MKKLGLLIIGTIIGVFPVFAQNEKNIAPPDEQIIVNKQFDENGNMIGYDSTYINSWSSDSSYHFNFDDNFGSSRFPDISQFLNDFFSDSSNFHSTLPPDFYFSPFNDDSFFGNLNPSFSDTAFINQFNFKMDSLQNFRHNFVFPDMQLLHKQMQDHFRKFDFHNQFNPNELNDEQLKELKELQKKHQKELEELQNKWKEQ